MIQIHTKSQAHILQLSPLTYNHEKQRHQRRYRYQPASELVDLVFQANPIETPHPVPDAVLLAKAESGAKKKARGATEPID